MANSDKPRGLTPIRHFNGSPWNGQSERMYIDASYGTALFVGDPVIPSGSGSAGGIPGIQAAGASGIPIGVIVGFEPTPTNLSTLHSAASTEGYAYVCTAPDVVYEIQEDSGGAALAVTDIGLNADMVAGAGDATTGRSAYELDSSTAATTNTLALRILGLVQRPDNEIGNNAKWEVMINTHQNRAVLGV